MLPKHVSIGGTLMRKCDVFLHYKGELLGQHGFIPDPGQVECTDTGEFVFYHYTRPQYLEQIYAPGSGLYARLPVVYGERSPHLENHYLVEGYLEPLPQWLTASPYFGDLGLQMMRAYVGDVLLRIAVPLDFPGLYIADLAHAFEGKHYEFRGTTVLNIGYDCRTGRETMLAELHSYVPMAAYRGGHVAPNVKATRYGQGIVVPNEFITICDHQPLQQIDESSQYL